MKKTSVLLTLLLSFYFSEAQVIHLDSLYLKSFHFPLRVGKHIQQKPFERPAAYNYAEVWKFLDVEYKERPGQTSAGDEFFKLVNRRGDTAWIRYDVVNFYRNDEFAFISPKNFARLQLKYRTSFKRLMHGDLSLGSKIEQIKIAKGLPTDIANSPRGMTDIVYTYGPTDNHVEYYHFNRKGKLLAIAKSNW